jgi:hypothetical protein
MSELADPRASQQGRMNGQERSFDTCGQIADNPEHGGAVRKLVTVFGPEDTDRTKIRSARLHDVPRVALVDL